MGNPAFEGQIIDEQFHASNCKRELLSKPQILLKESKCFINRIW